MKISVGWVLVPLLVLAHGCHSKQGHWACVEEDTNRSGGPEQTCTCAATEGTRSTYRLDSDAHCQGTYNCCTADVRGESGNWCGCENTLSGAAVSQRGAGLVGARDDVPTTWGQGVGSERGFAGCGGERAACQ